MENVKDLPLLDSQKEVWLAIKQNPNMNKAYNEAFELVFQGSFNLSKLISCIKYIINEHSVFSLVIDRNKPIQDLMELECDSQFIVDENIDYNNWYKKSLSHSITVGDFPLYRFHFLVLENKIYFIMLYHHILLDGFSRRIFIEEIMRLYKNDVFPEYKTSNSKYIDYILASNSPQDSAILDFWKDEWSTVEISDQERHFSQQLESEAETLVFNINDQRKIKINNFCRINRISKFIFY
ncbi:MAG: hypothetical protein JEY91_05280, partial [Spirochaetaceae bacterium]|nr:hypothetical protein [Spirochaetaceae bacterium]